MLPGALMKRSIKNAWIGIENNSLLIIQLKEGMGNGENDKL